MSSAESAMCALGPQLEWRERFIDTWDGCNGRTAYTITKMRADRWESMLLGQYGRYPYLTFDAAKAACERHYATGKWD